MNTLPPLRNRAIAASAGTGKTFQLAHRYIELLRRGVTPDRICALTFSRKAAGEIFDAIVACLCAAALDSDKARRSSALLGIPTAPEEFLALLRTFADNLHRLRIGTIDSFTVSVARAFTLELGLSPDFRMGDSHDAESVELRRDLLARLFDPSRTDARDRRTFLEAHKLATFGREDKDIGRTLEGYLATLSDAYRGMRDPSVWGNEQAIWRAPLPWRRLPDGEAEACAASLRSAADALPPGIAPAAREMAALLAAHNDMSEWGSKHENTLFKRFWHAVSEPDGTPFELAYNRRQARLPPAAADALRALIRQVMAIELSRCCRQTRGMARVLEQYERLYRDEAGRGNRMTFDDLTRLLDADGPFKLSRARAPDRLYIDYRLDGRLDHWLLDEFQDTSDAQWRVLRDLIDETAQDDSGQRSFFYVGDTKQAIYGWRGGNHRLFGEVETRYADRIECLSLDDSHRSATPIVNTVNRIFLQAVREPGIPAQARADWSKIWRAHRAARADAGCVELLEASPKNGEASNANDALYDAIAGRLRDILPVARGLQAAVLVRTNEQGRRCVDRLRARCPGQAILLDGVASLLDNALVPLMLALVRVAAHPGDTLSWRHLQMSPLGALPAFGAGGSPSDDADLRAVLTLRLSRIIHERGFLAALREGCGLLETVCPPDSFGRRRRDDLFAAAAAFDASGDRDCDRFDRHVRAYAPREPIASQAIRVMTIHQSKGLGFDLVFVPFPRSGHAFANPGRAALLTPANSAWALLPPPQIMTQTDPVLTAAEEWRAGDGAFAQLCVFYVALTRAKQGLYLVVPPPIKGESDICREETVLRHALAGEDAAESLPDSRTLFRAGEAGWYAERAPVALSHPFVPPDAAARPAWRPGAPRLVRREPSKLEPVTRSAASLFDRETGDVLAFGTAIHRLFRRIEWLDNLDIESIVAAWRASAVEDAAVLRDAERQFRAGLAQPEVRQALARPATPCLLWREKPFELTIDDNAVAGQFDRVMILCDPRGNPTAATILDFKSNRVESDDALRRTAEYYRDQLGLYAAALRHILGPTLNDVAQALLFTRAGRVVTLSRSMSDL